MLNISEKTDRIKNKSIGLFKGTNIADFTGEIDNSTLFEVGLSFLFDPVQEVKDYFISKVIFDGRYLDTFTKQPDLVAKELGVTLDAAVAEELRNGDAYELLAETDNRLKERIGQAILDNKLYGVATPAMDMSTGAAIVVAGVIAIAVIVKIIYPLCETQGEDIVDNSPEANFKL